MIIRKIIQWVDFKLEILSSIFGFLNEIKWTITNSIIKNKGSLCTIIKLETSFISKSMKMSFCTEYDKCSRSWTLNARNDRNIKYCVVKIEIIFPSLDFKNELFRNEGNILLMAVSIPTYNPCIIPKITKFQPAPCQIPMRNRVVNILENILNFDFLWFMTIGKKT